VKLLNKLSEKIVAMTEVFIMEFTSSYGTPSSQSELLEFQSGLFSITQKFVILVFLILSFLFFICLIQGGILVFGGAKDE
jgi:hypothetical protein